MKRLNKFVDEWINYPVYLAANIRTNPKDRPAHFLRYMGDLISENIVYGSAAYTMLDEKAAAATIATNTILRMGQFMKNYHSS